LGIIGGTAFPTDLPILHLFSLHVSKTSDRPTIEPFTIFRPRKKPMLEMVVRSHLNIALL
jgi:hypothetical protein